MTKIKQVTEMGSRSWNSSGGGNFGEEEMDIKWKEQQLTIWECLQQQ